LKNFIKNNFCKVSRRRARDRDRNPSRRDRDKTFETGPRQDLRDRDSKKESRDSITGDDTDNVAPRDIETSNGSIEFNDAVVIIMLFTEMCQRVCEEQK